MRATTASRFLVASPMIRLMGTLAVVAARVAAPSAHPLHASRALICGSQRWSLKTLQDRPKLISAKPTTIAHLVGLTRPKPAPTARSQFERHIYSITAAVTFVRQEADQDLHVVVQDAPGNHMIVEAPNAPFCRVNATAYRKKQMATARSRVQICSRDHITGVVFWDRPHVVIGRAPNAIELHPILGFVCLSA
jgi:hypothetical protein